MADIYIKLPKNEVREGSSLYATVYFRDDNSAVVPTTARYRIDCLTTGAIMRTWTDLTPAGSVDITIDFNDNAIESNYNNRERRQITVEIDAGLSTQTRNTAEWNVKNIEGF